MPLHFSGRKEGLKLEEEDQKLRDDRAIASASIQPLGAEADDEDEDGETIPPWRDSGIGTSLDDTDRRNVQRRRRALFGGGK